MTGPVQVEEVGAVDARLLNALARLIPQLSTSSAPLTDVYLRAVVEATSTTLFVARIDGQIVGTLSLAVFRIPTGTRAWIEDVVVDEEARGRGVGSALVKSAIERARAHGARAVDLTSRPSREAANALYQRLGFVQRATNVYRFIIETLEGEQE